MCKVIAICNQKGGVSKTTTTVNLGVGMVREGKRVLVIDADPQGNLSQSLGIENPDELEIALPTIMEQIIMDEEFDVSEGIIHHVEGIDLMPCNIDLSGVDVSLVNAMSREFVLKTYVDCMREYYDYILIDCMPSLGMITVNALTASDSVLIPVQAAYLPVKGLEQLITTIFRVRKHLNPGIQFEGILISMLNARTNYAKDIIELITEYYGESIPIFDSRIPFSVKAAETSAAGVSIFSLDKKHPVEDTDKSGSLNLRNELARPQISLIKEDADTKETVSGAAFSLCTAQDIYNVDGEKIVEAGTELTTLTTGEDGTAICDMMLPLQDENYVVSGSAVSGSAVSVESETVEIGNSEENSISKALNSGMYYLKEISISDSYYLDEEPIPVQLCYKDAVTPVIYVNCRKENKQTTDLL